MPERATAAVVVVPQNANPGWAAATADGTALTPVRIDGWQQGGCCQPGRRPWSRPSSGPDRWYRVGLLVGALALLGLVGWSVPGPPPHRPRPSGCQHGHSGGCVLAARHPGGTRRGGLAGGPSGVLALVLAIGMAVLPRRAHEDQPSRRHASPLAAALVLGLPTLAALLVARTPARRGHRPVLIAGSAGCVDRARSPASCPSRRAPRDINGRSTTTHKLTVATTRVATKVSPSRSTKRPWKDPNPGSRSTRARTMTW